MWIRRTRSRLVTTAIRGLGQNRVSAAQGAGRHASQGSCRGFRNLARGRAQALRGRALAFARLEERRVPWWRPTLLVWPGVTFGRSALGRGGRVRRADFTTVIVVLGSGLPSQFLRWAAPELPSHALPRFVGHRPGLEPILRRRCRPPQAAAPDPTGSRLSNFL